MLQRNYSLAPHTWFRTGGRADIFFRAATRQSLKDFLNQFDCPITVIGAGSNILIRDGGVYGAVIKLGRDFRRVSIDGDCVKAEASALSRTVCEVAADKGLTGLEFLVGIPGTIGGAVIMNAGAHGRETKECLESIEVMNRRGDIYDIPAKDLVMTYRSCELPNETIVLSATFKLEKKPKKDIMDTMREYLDARNRAQPIHIKTGGSTFKNPAPSKKAWELIDAVGLRGHKLGDAQINQKHCNFIVNTGHSTSTEIEELGELARTKVHDAFGVDLEWEIRRIGRFL